MEDEIARLRQALEYERRLREEAESRASEEQRRRKKAEEVAEKSRPLRLEPYLEACHTLNLAIEVHQLDYVLSLITPINSEHGLRYYERDTVKNVVQKLVDAVYENPVLRASIGLRRTITFESHTNLGTMDSSPSEHPERTPLSAGSAGEPALATSAAVRKRRRIARGKGNRADQFCIYKTSDGAKVPAIAIEYKAPYKLSREELVIGLVSEIQPERDVINKDGDGFAFAAKRLATAIYGYVCTGEAFVFLHIPDDLAMVYYHLYIPNQDVLNDDKNRLHRTAVTNVMLPHTNPSVGAASNARLFELVRIAPRPTLKAILEMMMTKKVPLLLRVQIG
ncbi:hypothetical protein MYCTH_2120910 [Thermothelomyces thermophilus ATCC 42464]|uniref:Uncharacterized protein n=1 Tax=Thermothelomyces thermophilus (strain ATCC 42464 / BCRC 31852 / DSM 1799) TaxID=573729 RepID=G2QM22_THET4|nr:uncharacterized protein MYCTH_2120910 [Thermothelomyces thermophilus ATCC 42464]AEO61002.1 hypothetical protein MYCTH_2120910 [Thermothelomyces thermophilus ATCC 42464]